MPDFHNRETDPVDPERIAEALDEILRSPLRTVHMITLTTGERLWGKITGRDDTGVRIDTGRGLRTLGIDTVSDVYTEVTSAGPE